jgi:hypothetical protein
MCLLQDSGGFHITLEEAAAIIIPSKYVLVYYNALLDPFEGIKYVVPGMDSDKAHAVRILERLVHDYPNLKVKSHGRILKNLEEELQGRQMT